MEIKRTDLPADTLNSDSCKWLLLDKQSLSITELTVLALNFSDLNEERFFRQGYLSFGPDQAIYIRESSSVQIILKTRENSELPHPFLVIIKQWLSETGLS